MLEITVYKNYRKRTLQENLFKFVYFDCTLMSNVSTFQMKSLQLFEGLLNEIMFYYFESL